MHTNTVVSITVSVSTGIYDTSNLFTPSCKQCSEGKNDQQILALQGVRWMLRQPKNHQKSPEQNHGILFWWFLDCLNIPLTPCKARICWSFFPSKYCLQLGVWGKGGLSPLYYYVWLDGQLGFLYYIILSLLRKVFFITVWKFFSFSELTSLIFKIRTFIMLFLFIQNAYPTEYKNNNLLQKIIFPEST